MANLLPQHFHFFTSRLDCMGRMSISALMKCTASIRQFAYGSTADAFDEYFQMSEHTARDALFFFNMCIIELYMPKYLRKPTSEDVVNIQQKHNTVHGFPGMLGSIDCMQWEWKNCPVSRQGQYGRGDKKYPTVIWHAFYGIAGANNDINVLDNSSLFDDLLDDLAPVVLYVINGVEYRNGYYLADGIYPEWASFVKPFTVATDPKHTYFKQQNHFKGLGRVGFNNLTLWYKRRKESEKIVAAYNKKADVWMKGRGGGGGSVGGLRILTDLDEEQDSETEA
nr:hypothetical protein [Tanacetum cinerariifolium]